MNISQPYLFEEMNAEIDTAIDQVALNAVHNENASALVREAAAHAVGQRRGSVILCAAPADINAQELVIQLSRTIEALYQSRNGKACSGIRSVATPCVSRRIEESLMDAYGSATDSAGVRHQYPPKFELLPGDAFIPRSRFQLVTSLVQCRPAEYYIFNNIHLLQSANMAPADAVDRLTTILEMAGQTGKTHLLVGHTRVLLDWLEHPEIARRAHACVLAPYDLQDDSSKLHFSHLLEAYDAILPWADGDSLASHLQDVHLIVAGSPHRLRKWLTTALCNAKAHGEKTLSWSRFYYSQPSSAEQREAKAEFFQVMKYLRRPVSAGAMSDAEITAPKRPGTNTTPGICKPDRDDRAA